MLTVSLVIVVGVVVALGGVLCLALGDLARGLP